MRRRALLGAILVGGAALAAPLPVLELDGGGQRVLALDAGGAFSYEYRQSIYDAPVEERFRLEGGRLRLERVRSPHPAALEYFRWPGEVRTDGAWLSIDAPGVLEEELVIRVAAAGEQKVRTRPAYVVYLGGSGAETVRVRGSARPLAMWLPLWLTQIDR